MGYKITYRDGKTEYLEYDTFEIGEIFVYFEDSEEEVKSTIIATDLIARIE